MSRVDALALSALLLLAAGHTAGAAEDSVLPLPDPSSTGGSYARSWFATHDSQAARADEG